MTDEQKDETVEVEEESPVFDWDDISVNDFDHYMELNQKVIDSQDILDDDLDENTATHKEIRANMRKKLKAATELRIIQSQLRDILIAALISVPRSWLVTSAPESIEQKDLMGYIKNHKSQSLSKLYLSGGSEEPKN